MSFSISIFETNTSGHIVNICGNSSDIPYQITSDLIDILKHNTGKNIVIFKNLNFNDDSELAKIADSIITNPTLIGIHFINCTTIMGSSMHFLSQFVKNIKNSTNLELITLKNCELTDNEAQSLFLIIQRSPYLKMLDCSNNQSLGCMVGHNLARRTFKYASADRPFYVSLANCHDALHQFNHTHHQNNTIPLMNYISDMSNVMNHWSLKGVELNMKNIKVKSTNYDRITDNFTIEYTYMNNEYSVKLPPGTAHRMCVIALSNSNIDPQKICVIGPTKSFAKYSSIKMSCEVNKWLISHDFSFINTLPPQIQDGINKIFTRYLLTTFEDFTTIITSLCDRIFGGSDQYILCTHTNIHPNQTNCPSIKFSSSLCVFAIERKDFVALTSMHAQSLGCQGSQLSDVIANCINSQLSNNSQTNDPVSEPVTKKQKI